MLVSKNAKICVTPDAKPKICVSPKAKPQRKSVEYRLCWVPNANFSRWACTFHICVSISFALGTPFPVEYGLNSKAHITPQRESLKQCPTRAYNAQHEPHGTRDVGLHWACIFQVICVNFIRVGYPTKTRSLVEYGLKSQYPPPPRHPMSKAAWRVGISRH